MKGRVIQLDVLRAVSILLVVFYHFYINFSKIPLWNDVVMNGGQLGVNMFFVLSGMLISYPFVKNSLQHGKMGDVKHYIVNRMLRILPLFWTVSTIAFIFKEHIHLYHEKPANLTVSDWFMYLFFMNDKLDILNPVVWTLRIEVFFYVLFPILFYCTLPWHKQLLKHAYTLFAVIFLLFFAYRYAFVAIKGDMPYNDMISNLEGFFMGVLVSFIITGNHQGNLFRIPLPVIIPIVTLLVLLHLHETTFKDQLYYFPYFRSISNAATFLLFIGMLRKQHFQIKWNWLMRAISFISLISYSLYLLHFNIYFNVTLPLVNRYVPNASVAEKLRGPLALVVAVVLSYITYMLIEKPFLSLKTKILNPAK